MSALTLSANIHYKYEDFRPVVTCTGTATVLPTPATGPTGTVVKHPENIFVQADQANTTNILIGKSTVLADGSKGGYLLAPGSNMSLPSKEYANYYQIAVSGSPKLYVTYQRGPY